MAVGSSRALLCPHADITSPSDFLLFMPPQAHNLRAVISYYQSSVKVNAEGDVHLSDDTIQGLGNPASSFLITSLLGAITQIASPTRSPRPEMLSSSTPVLLEPLVPLAPHQALAGRASHDGDKELLIEVAEAQLATRLSKIRSALTQFVPDPGYFIAGGLAGVASRTTTAPLDRLKVYLIAQTGAASEAVNAAKTGAPVQAATQGANTLVNACKELWAAGGMRSLFAGQSESSPLASSADTSQAMASMSSR